MLLLPLLLLLACQAGESSGCRCAGLPAGDSSVGVEPAVEPAEPVVTTGGGGISVAVAAVVVVRSC